MPTTEARLDAYSELVHGPFGSQYRPRTLDLHNSADLAYFNARVANERALAAAAAPTAGRARQRERVTVNDVLGTLAVLLWVAILAGAVLYTAAYFLPDDLQTRVQAMVTDVSSIPDQLREMWRELKDLFTFRALRNFGAGEF